MIFYVGNDQVTCASLMAIYSPTASFGTLRIRKASMALFHHIGERNPFFEHNIDLGNDFPEGNDIEPFEPWVYVEPD